MSVPYKPGMITAETQSNTVVSETFSSKASAFERKVYLTDTKADRTFSGLLNFCIESGNGLLHISMADVSVYQYSSCMPLYNLSNLDLSRPKDFIFIEEAA